MLSRGARSTPGPPAVGPAALSGPLPGGPHLWGQTQSAEPPPSSFLLPQGPGWEGGSFPGSDLGGLREVVVAFPPRLT